MVSFRDAGATTLSTRQRARSNRSSAESSIAALYNSAAVMWLICFDIGARQASFYSKMPRLPLQKLPMSMLPHEFPIPYRNLPAHRDMARPPLKFPAFKRAVIEVHALRLHRDFAAIVWIKYHQVGVRAGLDRALAREQIEGLRHLRAGDIYERMQVDLPRLHTVGVQQVDAFFERRDAVGDFGEIIFAHRLLGLEIKRRMIGGNSLHQPVPQSVPENCLISLVA